jgi:gamma-glutamylcyclotransferase (GGCT)/AIG2-like uncharacterized protein YtfP
LMTESVNYLFVYGTLLQKGNKFAAFLNENSRFYGKGKVSGKLYDVGEYPGLVLQLATNHFVYGRIYSMTDPEAILKVLDDYEGFGEDQVQPNEFIRVLTAIESENDVLKCWVYLYNLPVNGLRHIISGDYLASRI